MFGPYFILTKEQYHMESGFTFCSATYSVTLSKVLSLKDCTFLFLVRRSVDLKLVNKTCPIMIRVIVEDKYGGVIKS